jgi:hypothetical protein
MENYGAPSASRGIGCTEMTNEEVRAVAGFVPCHLADGFADCRWGQAHP